MNHSVTFPFLRLAWLAATAALLLSGCGKGGDSHPLAALPEKVVLIEQSADLRALINAELAAGKKRIVIPPGRYRVPSEKGSHLQFKNLSGVEIIANNVELVCTSTVQAVLFDHCSRWRKVIRKTNWKNAFRYTIPPRLSSAGEMRLGSRKSKPLADAATALKNPQTTDSIPFMTPSRWGTFL